MKATTPVPLNSARLKLLVLPVKVVPSVTMAPGMTLFPRRERESRCDLGGQDLVGAPKRL